jgi:catechol 2,3-dioxygenase-like lactoylglutathione lyase family enzyme
MFRFDGGFLMVPMEKFDEGVDWFVTHLGWECLDKIQTWVGRKAFLKLPREGVVTLKSFEGDYEHFHPYDGEEGNVRLCFASVDFDGTIQFAEENGLKVSEVKSLPDQSKTCDLYTFNDIRLTIIEDLHANCDQHDFPEAGIVGFCRATVRIGVSDVEEAADWYEKNLGFIKKEVHKDKGYAWMQTEDAHDRNVRDESFLVDILLEQTENLAQKPNDTTARTYFDIRPNVFLDEYNQLIKSGIKPSEIAGNPLKGWGGFHIYDPDNNRINIWSYKPD